MYSIPPLALLSLLAGPAAAQPASSQVNDAITYSSIPKQLPGNVTSLGFEAASTNEFGDEVELAPQTGTVRTLKTLRVVLSSFACQTGTWSAGNCGTTAGATFSHPMTANIYAVDNSGPTPTPAGAPLATVTVTPDIAYRPAADPFNCTGADAGKWFSAKEQKCYNGFAQTVQFKFPKVDLPDQVIWTVAFNTTHSGYSPIGESAACYTADGGCPYDSLNVGAQTFPGAPFAGTDVDPNGVFLNSDSGSEYCDGGAGGTGTLRLDTPCWTGFTPLGEIRTQSN
ncbi:hypothetical protein ACWGIU_25465 [Streptomyces sp. NPDC054840]